MSKDEGSLIHAKPPVDVILLFTAYKGCTLHKGGYIQSIFQQLDIHHKMYGWIKINCCCNVLSIEFSETRILKATPFTHLLVGTFGCLPYNINACHAHPIFLSNLNSLLGCLCDVEDMEN